MRKYSRTTFAIVDRIAEATVEELDAIHEIGLAVADQRFRMVPQSFAYRLGEPAKAAGVKMEVDGNATAESRRTVCRQDVCADRKAGKLHPR